MNETTGATCASLLTPPGRGAVAVVAVVGADAVRVVDRYFRAAHCRPLAQHPPGRIVYGRWSDAAGEDVVVSRRNDHHAEIHCHGGQQSARQILSELVDAGCELQSWQQRVGGEASCSFAAEARVALAAAPTQRTARILLDQLQGALRREWEAIATQLHSDDPKRAQKRLERLLALAPLGLHLTTPWQVAIAGRPNVGKSSLLNALLGYARAIVYDQPGTTRDVLTAPTAVEGWPIQLADTAGMRHSDESVEQAGIALAKQQLASADLVLWVLDAAQLPVGGELKTAQSEAVAMGLKFDPARTLVVVNKIDLVEARLPSTALGTCAVSGDGVPKLLSAIASQLVPHSPAQGAAVPFTASQVRVLEQVVQATRSQNWTVARDLLSQEFTK